MKRYGFLLLSLLLVSICNAGSWNYELYHSVKDFDSWDTAQGMVRGADGTLYVAYGGDRLYVASSSGSGWTIETVDNEIEAGKAPCILAADNGDLNVLYFGLSDFRHAVKPAGSSNWTVRIVSQLWASRVSAALDSNGAIHFVTTAGNRPIYMTNASGDWIKETLPCNDFAFWGCHLAIDSNDEPVIGFCSRGIRYLPPQGYGIIIWADTETIVATRNAGSWSFQTIYDVGQGVLLGLALDSQDHIHLLVTGDVTDYPYYELQSFRWNGWGYDWSIVDPAVNPLIAPSIVYDSFDTAHVSLRTYPSQLVHGVESGASWILETVDTGVRNSSLILDDMDNPVIAGFYPETLAMKSHVKQSTSWQTETIDQAGFSPDYFYDNEMADMVIDSTGTPHLALCRDTNLYHAWRTGSQWFIEVIDDRGPHWFGYDCDLEIDSQDHLHVSYNSNDPVTGFYYAVNNGSGWISEEIFQSQLRHVNAMALAPDGTPVFVSTHVHSTSLYFRRKVNDVWTEFLIDDAGFYTQNADIAMDSTGQAHITYYNEEFGELRYAVGLDDTWVIETVDGGSGNRGYSNHIVLDDTNSPYISYRGNGLSVASKNGASWIIDNVAPMNSSDTAIVLDSLGYPRVAGDNKYALFDGMNWQVDTFDVSGCQYTTMALTSDDMPLIFFKDKAKDYRFIYKEPTAPEIDSINPHTLYQEQSYQDVTVTGTGFTDVSEVTCGSGIIIDNWNIVSDTEMTLDLVVSEFTRTGPRNVSVSTNTGVAVCDSCLVVEQGPPHIEALYPEFCPKDFSYPISISGQNFLDTLSVEFADGIVVDSFAVLSAEEIVANITVSASVPDGFHDVTVTNPAGTDTLSQCFETGTMIAMWEFEVMVPERVSFNTPFLVTIYAIDYSGHLAMNWSGTVSMYDTATYSITPNTAEIIDGVGVVEATLATPAFKNQVRISWEGREGYSNFFDVTDAPAQCEFEEVGFDTMYNHLGDDTWPSQYVDIAPDGTIWVAFGIDNLWVYHGDGINWVRERVDSEPGTGACTSLSLDPEGYPHISYNDRVRETTKYAWLSPHGWQIEVMDANGWQRGETAIAVDGNSVPHVVFFTRDGMTYGYRQPDGSWVKQLLDDRGCNECDIVVDSLNRPHITTYRRYGPRKYFGYLNDVWTESTPTGATGEYGGIAVDSLNRPHVCSYEYSSGHSDIRHTYWDGSQWAGEIIPNTDGCIFSEIDLDSMDRPAVVTKYDGDIRYLYHDGSTWQYEDMPVELGMWDPTMVRDSNGWPHIVVHAGDHNQMQYCTWDGSQWFHSAVMRDGIVGQYNRILIDSNDELSIVSVDEETPYNNSLTSVRRVTHRWPQSGFWDSDTLFEVEGYIGLDAELSSNDEPIYAIKATTDVSNYYYCYYDGPTFVSELIYADFPDAFIDLELDSNNNPWIAFSYGAQSENHLAVARKVGANWIMDNLIVSGYVSENCMAIGPDDLPQVVFVSNYEGYWQLYLAKFTGSSWTINSPYPHPGYMPKIVVDDQNVPHIAVTNDGLDTLYYLTHDGQDWVTETISQKMGYNHYPGEIILDSQNNPHVTFGVVDDDEFIDHTLVYGTRVADQWYTYTVKEDAKTIVSNHIVIDSDDVPHFSYYNEWSGDLMYSTCGIFTPPVIDSVYPGSAYPGEHIEDIEITGTGLFPVTSLNFGDDVRVDHFTVITNSQILVDVTVNAGAAPGLRDVRVTAPAGVGSCTGCFMVTDSSLATPMVSDVSPSQGNIWETYRVTVFGENLETASMIGFGSDIIVESVQVLDSQSVQADIQIEPWADLGRRSVTVVTEAGEAECNQCFEVVYFEPEAPTPTITPSPTPTSQYTNTPTATPTNTATLTPTHTPTIIPTDTPTSIPSQTHTPVPSITPTPVPTSCDYLGTHLELSQETPYRAGDMFWLKLDVCNNTEQPLSNVPTCVLLGVYDQFWFWPTWTMEFAWQTETYETGLTTVAIFEEFVWPEVQGEAFGLEFYSAILNESMTELVGEFGYLTFGYSE